MAAFTPYASLRGYQRRDGDETSGKTRVQSSFTDTTTGCSGHCSYPSAQLMKKAMAKPRVATSPVSRPAFS